MPRKPEVKADPYVYIYKTHGLHLLQGKNVYGSSVLQKIALRITARHLLLTARMPRPMGFYNIFQQYQQLGPWLCIFG